VTNADDNTVSVIETASNTVVATIPVGQVPTGVAITPDGTRAYVTNFCGRVTCADSDFTVSVIDTARNTVVSTISVGQEPIGVAFATVTPSHRNSEQ
jgi:YVTN family beta-propeller protein